MKKIALMSLVASSVLMAGGYKIPETSTNAVALGAANIAHNHENADAAYYNPAKMVFMQDKNNLEVDLTYIGLDKVKYKGSVGALTNQNLHSEKEDFVVPTLHYVSPKLGENNARVGVSITAPGGLSKQWKTEPARTSAEEFTLEIVEVNPTAAFKINDKLGFAVGFRIVNTSGIVKSNGITNIPALGGLGTVSRDMTGDSTDFGYNLALAYQPTKELEIGLTYRSKVDLSVEGNAKLATSLAGGSTYDGSASVSVPLPASWNIAAAYTFETKTTLEMVYERTMWSAYNQLDFDYDGSQGPVLEAIFGTVIPKDWKDTNTFRFGLTQELNDLTVMAGLVIDETPTPEATVGFELPDTDTTSVSLGGRYKINDKIDVGLSGLYSMHKSRKVHNTSLNGEFSDGDILIISAGLGYKF
ncbi:OmpP1/FadL family transporter [Sulfurimonas paralvinellae]|uniref:Transporter n=1 Tax=Sulfurimonas paralvinellae TaxID=317658 RepID=A0A7M1BC66_9BACT|nr:OmpP1/FadL family transporter [Sulfurimonas paralvinellae]QOP46382.1 transporter [Sulfurimonas paralvinellae]